MKLRATYLELTQLDVKIFEDLQDTIIKSLTNLSNNSLVNMELATKWGEVIVNANISKENTNQRKLLVGAAYKCFAVSPNNDPSKLNDKLMLAFVLDWCLEFINAANIMANNIVDNRTMLADKPTWHERPNVGMMAINDSLILKGLGFNLLKIYFGDQSELCNKLEDLRRDASDNYIIGRGIYEKLKSEKDSTHLTLEKYRQIIDFTVGYGSFYTPVMFAMALAEINIDMESKADLKGILFDIGYYHQMETDYINVIARNKVDEDLTESDLKINWLFIKMVETLKNNEPELIGLLRYVKLRNVSELVKIYEKNDVLNFYADEMKIVKNHIMSKITNFQQVYNNANLVKFLRLLAFNVTTK